MLRAQPTTRARFACSLLPAQTTFESLNYHTGARLSREISGGCQGPRPETLRCSKHLHWVPLACWPVLATPLMRGLRPAANQAAPHELLGAGLYLVEVPAWVCVRAMRPRLRERRVFFFIRLPLGSLRPLESCCAVLSQPPLDP